MSVCCGSLSGAVTCLTRGIGCMVCCPGRYRALPVESVTDNAGTLDPNMDIGEYVRFQTAKERTQVTPPWFFPTHLCTCTVRAGLGPKMDMFDAQSISISREIRGGSPSFFFTSMHSICVLRCSVPQPQHIPKGTRLDYSFKYKYDFARSGLEPPINRVCRLRVVIPELKLTAVERHVFDRIMGPRVRFFFLSFSHVFSNPYPSCDAWV